MWSGTFTSGAYIDLKESITGKQFFVGLTLWNNPVITPNPDNWIRISATWVAHDYGNRGERTYIANLEGSSGTFEFRLTNDCRRLEVITKTKGHYTLRELWVID